MYGSVGTSNATWTLEAKQNSAVYSGTYTLETTGRHYSPAELTSELHFTLLESASYSLTATFEGFFVPTGYSSAFMGASLESRGIGGSNVVGGTFQLGGGEPLTGTLEPGAYIFTFISYLINGFEPRFPDVVSSGAGNGQFALTLNSQNGNGNGDHGNRHHVSDGGSTLAMLGMALTMLVGIARLRAACS